MDDDLPPRSAEDDLRVVYHEVSHVAVGRRFSPLGGCTCEPGPGYSGLVWGPSYVRRSKFSDQEVPDLCSQISVLMPGPGESRADVADIYLHTFERCTELVAGTEGERLFLPGEPWFAVDDERQAIAYAGLICSSQASVAAFVDACRVEARELLIASSFIVHALAAELQVKRTMDGAAIDSCIARAVSTQGAVIERANRDDWQRRLKSAARFADHQERAYTGCRNLRSQV
jgi:hypothetical protein